MEKKVGESIETSTRLHLQGAIRRRINKVGAIPWYRKREGGNRKREGGQSLVILEGRQGNPL